MVFAPFAWPGWFFCDLYALGVEVRRVGWKLGMFAEFMFEAECAAHVEIGYLVGEHDVGLVKSLGQRARPYHNIGHAVLVSVDEGKVLVNAEG